MVATCDGNDGEITVTASGGTTPYQYSLNNGSTWSPNNVLIAPNTGNFDQIIVKDANGCTVQTFATVSYTNNLAVSLGADTTICQTDSIRMMPQITGNANVFTWTPTIHVSNPNIANPIIAPSDTTIYTFTIQQGPCSASAERTFNVKWKPLAHAGADTVVCYNQPAFLSGTSSHTSGAVTNSWIDTCLLYTSPSPRD